MANTGLNVSDVVSVQVVMSPVAAALRNFGALLILGDSNVIDTAERIRQYSDIDGVIDDFGTSAPEYLAASLFFGQSPQPEVLYVGKWARAATSAVLHGGILSAAEQAISNFTSITNGGFSIVIDGAAATVVTALNLSAVTTLSGVAAAVQAKLPAGVTCVWNPVYGRFDITSSTTGATSTLAFATAPGSGTDARAALKIGSTNGGSIVNGIAAESLLSAVGTMADMSNDWYGLKVASSVSPSENDVVAVAGLIEASGVSRIYGVTTQDTGVLSAADTGCIASQLKALGYKRTFVQYSSSNKYAAASIFGRAFTVDFDGSNTTLTIKFKQEPGVVAEYLTATQAATLKDKNCNVFVAYNNDTSIIQEGVMANGYFFDEVHGTDWLQNAVQTAIYNLLYTSTTKIPQTDAGVGLIVATICKELDRAVTNGLVAPGIWNAGGFGALKQGDTLAKGYYVYAQPVASQSQATREAREAPVIQCAIKLAGAIHFVDCIINVNR